MRQALRKKSKKSSKKPGIGAASNGGMSILIIATGFVLTGILIGLIATATAPVGYEDANGFHFGNEKGQAVPSREQEFVQHLPSTAGLTHSPA